MEQQRPLLYLMLGFIAFMIWSTWEQRNYAPPAPVAQSTSLPNADGNPASAINQPDVPQTSGLPAAAAAQGATAAGVAGKSIRIKTDVLDLYYHF